MLDRAGGRQRGDAAAISQQLQHHLLAAVAVARAGVLGGLLVWTGSAAAGDTPYSQPVTQLFPRQVLWGDTHLHTRNSADAYTLKNTNLGAADAYRFARGETVVAHNGMSVKLRRPLDFLVVSDHAEYLGVFARVADGDPSLMAIPVGRRWKDYMDRDQYPAMFEEFVELLGGDRPSVIPDAVRMDIWSEITRTADAFYEPGLFTTFSAYEWSSQPGGNNLHRVVIFADDAARVSKFKPFSAKDSADPEALWQFFSEYERSTGGRVLAIPHNGNVSNGLMFSPNGAGGQPFTKAYAEQRSKWEPLYEVTQMKGDGETHPQLSPQDPFADFETWDTANIMRNSPKEDWMLQYEYARSALKEGLAHQSRLGVNPFKFGMLGSTDSHTSLATTEENNFFGKFPESEPGPDRTSNKMGGRLAPNIEIGAAGLAAVWADTNTREGIFEAMQRKEVYATTGSRILLRLFAGWEIPDDAHQHPDPVALGYEYGTPMGSDLAAAGNGKAPKLLILASRDPDGANLERVQVVKGWLDPQGRQHEKVYDAILTDTAADTASVPLDTVNVAQASYRNSIGEPYLATVWRDPDFDAGESAFYYIRVLEIPTPRWTAYDARYFDIGLPADTPMQQQDRAYSSPIWYQPR